MTAKASDRDLIPAGTFLSSFKGIFTDPLLLYVLFLLSVPQGVLDLFSPYHFTTPGTIHYELLNSPVSLLFLPVLLFVGHHVVTARKPALNLKGLTVFWLLFLVWQPLNIWLFSHPEKVGLTGEMFFAYTIAFAFLYAVAARRRTADELSHFLLVFAALQCLGAIGGLLAGQKSLLERINAPNLDIGNSSLLFGAFSLLLAVRPGRQRFLALFPIPFLVLTGSRSTLVITLLVLPFALSSAATQSRGMATRHKITKSLLWGGLTIGILLLSAKFMSSQNVDVSARMNSLIDPSQLSSDSSTLGRLASIAAGMQVLASNPAGLPFSLIELQHMMNRFGYPTFPHNNFLVILILFGPFSLIVIFMIIKYGIRLFRSASPYRFCFGYFLIYSMVAGGCTPYFKPIFIYIIFFFLFMRDLHEKSQLGMRGRSDVAWNRR